MLCLIASHPAAFEFPTIRLIAHLFNFLLLLGPGIPLCLEVFKGELMHDFPVSFFSDGNRSTVFIHFSGITVQENLVPLPQSIGLRHQFVTGTRHDA